MNNKHVFYLAPLRGVTDYIFRNTFERYFGQFDYLLTPFVPTVKGESVNPSHCKDVNPQHNDTQRVIPQIIGNVPSEIALLANHLHGLGYKSVNLNLGCPHPQITRKKRGSGLLSCPELLDTILEQTLSQITCPFSVKVRLGLESADELEKVIPVLNRFDLQEVTIHPRTGAQMYEGTVDLDAFEKYHVQIRHPVCYNGDIWSAECFNEYSARFKSISKWMLGRGVVQNPFLLKQLRSDTGTHNDMKILQAFHDDIYAENARRLSGPSHLLGKMKELWFYLAHSFADPKRVLKKILKKQNVDGYCQAVKELFGEEPVYSPPEFPKEL